MKNLMVLLAVVVIAFVAVFVFQNIGKNTTTDETTQETSGQTTAYVPSGSIPTATITIEGYGDIVAELYPEVAPNTVNNFIALAEAGYYDGLTFHRIIKDFMIQGGDPEGTGGGGPGYAIAGEFAQNGFQGPTLSHEVGVLSMARTNDPNSAGSQFFIVSGQAGHLDGQYASFGKVVEGLDIVEQLQNVETNNSDAPITPVIMSQIAIDLNGYTPAEVVKVSE
ncbi:MAG: peptidylprolyl isomerase [Culicoidibacterales bacterium]